MKNLFETPTPIKTFANQFKHMTHVEYDIVKQGSWTITLAELMASKGFKSIGSGNYGTVFTKTGYPYAIKVFMKDTAYLKWLHFVQQNQSNQYVPKIKGKVVRITDVFFAVRIELLNDSVNVEQHNIISDFIDLLVDPEDSLEGFGPNKRPVEDPNLRNILMLLIRNKRLCDLHHGNIMLRGNQPVVIDPFYNWNRGGKFTIDPDDISEFKSLF